MDFSLLNIKLTFLGSLVLIGYILGRFVSLNQQTISSVLLYVIAPVVFFKGMLILPLEEKYFLLPLLFFCLGSAMALIAQQIGKRFWQDTTKNIFAFTAGTGNTGYFGIPVATALLGEIGASLAILATVGFTLYENTVGYFLMARGNYSVRDSLLRVIRLPFLYALAAGLLLNLLVSDHHANQFAKHLTPFVEAYSLLGMMMVGIVLANAKFTDIDGWLMTWCLLMRFVAWPLVIGSLITLDILVLHFLDVNTYLVMVLMSVVPLAANSVVMAVQLNTQPKKVVTVVLVSIIIAMLIIPLLFTRIKLLLSAATQSIVFQY